MFSLLKEGVQVGFSYRLSPNISWIVIPVIVICWLFGLVSAWMALLLFFVYILIAMAVLCRNPKIRKEAEEFSRQLEENRKNKEKERIKQTLINSVEIIRK